MAAANTGFVVPTSQVRYLGSGARPHFAGTYVAEGAFSPTNLVKGGTAANQVVVNTTSVYPVGVADLNYDAAAERLNTLTHAFAANDVSIVLKAGIVVVVADTSAISADTRVMTGDTDGAEVEDYGSTGANAGDTYKTANLDLIADEINTTLGYGLIAGASAASALIDLRL